MPLYNAGSFPKRLFSGHSYRRVKRNVLATSTNGKKRCVPRSSPRETFYNSWNKLVFFFFFWRTQENSFAPARRNGNGKTYLVISGLRSRWETDLDEPRRPPPAGTAVIQRKHINSSSCRVVGALNSFLVFRWLPSCPVHHWSSQIFLCCFSICLLEFSSSVGFFFLLLPCLSRSLYDFFLFRLLILLCPHFRTHTSTDTLVWWIFAALNFASLTTLFSSLMLGGFSSSFCLPRTLYAT